MRFSKFLTEKEEVNNLSANILIVMHRIFSAIELTHIEKHDGMCELNIGQAIKDKNFKALNIAVQTGKKLSAKFAVKDGDDDYYIVVTSPKYNDNSSREDITAILEEEDLKAPLHDAIKNFLKYAKNDFNEKNVPSAHEEKVDSNKNVDQKYEDLIKAVKLKLEDHNKTTQEINRQSQITSNNFKKDSYAMAIDKLKKETHGSNFKEFLSIVSKLPEGKFIALLDKDVKPKILSRLEDYYEHYMSKS